MRNRKKLTLSIDENVIARAKRYSRRHKKSVSDMVETYLSRLDKESKTRYPPEVERLIGILPPAADEEAYHRHLEEKYLGRRTTQ